MQTNKRNWRISPTPQIEYAVEALARRENRSLANMLFCLLVEALENRRQAQARTAEHERLVAMIKAPADAPLGHGATR